jgi:pilus assembly protein CpaF
MTHSFQPYPTRPAAASTTAPNGSRHNGDHYQMPSLGSIGALADQAGGEVADEAVVARMIRRWVAERLTNAAREREHTAGLAMPPAERERIARQLITAALDAFAADQIAAGHGPLRPDAESRVARMVADSLLGAGGLQPLLDDATVEEIRAIGCNAVFVRRTDGSVEQAGPIADSDEELVDQIRVLAARTGTEERRWDRASPILNLQLPDGSRLNAVMAVAKRPSLSIRRHGYIKVTVADLVRLGTLDRCLGAFFTAAVRARLNTLISGRVGAGKTTTLRALASAIPPVERIVTIEDTFELGLDADAAAHREVVALQARDANVEGEGAIDMAELFRTGLRMTPDRVIVGEVRGHEVIPMLNAMSQGNDGSWGTIHASSSAGVFKKLVLYAAQSPERLAPETTNILVAEAVHLVVHLAFAADGRRVVTSVREVVDADGLQVSSNEVFRSRDDGRAVPGAPCSVGLMAVLEAHGFDPYLIQRPQGWWDADRRPS